jgi:hypothetical protein
MAGGSRSMGFFVRSMWIDQKTNRPVGLEAAQG